MSTLLIRADASPAIGVGHVMRCLALAQAWREAGGEAVLASVACPESMRQRIEAAGCRLAPLGHVHPHPEDLKRTLEIAQQVKAVWVVLDGYSFDADYQASVRAAGLRLMVVDDHRHLPYYHADLLFNQNIHAERLVYSADPGTVFLLGPRYVLVRPEFKSERERPRQIPEIARRVLVSLGGADPDNITAVVMDGLKGLDVEVRVIAGPVTKHVEELRSKCSRLCQPFGEQAGFRVQDSAEGLSAHRSPTLDRRLPTSTFNLLTNVSDMPALMAWADLAILVAGSTCWEACYLGLPMLTTVLSDNQRGVAAGLDEEGIGVNLGEGRDLRPDVVRESVRALLADADRRRRMRAAGRALVDGRGAARVAAMLGEGRIRLRPVTMDDAKRLLDWSNDPETRAMSFSSHPISSREHYDWLARQLADFGSRLFIAEDDAGRPIGHIRFEIRNGERVVSVNLAPEARGRRLSPFVIAAATAEVAREDASSRISAYIKADNERSRRSFLAAGYREDAAVVVNGVPAMRLVWQARG